MTYAEAYRAIEQMRPPGSWNISVQTWNRPSCKGAGRVVLTQWDFYCSTSSDGEAIMVDECDSPRALVDSVRVMLAGKGDGNVEDVGEVTVGR